MPRQQRYLIIHSIGPIVYRNAFRMLREAVLARCWNHDPDRLSSMMSSAAQRHANVTFSCVQPLAPSRRHARDSIRDAGALSVFPSSIRYLPAVLILCLTSVPIPFAGLRTWSTLPPCTYSDSRQLEFNTLRIPLSKSETVEPPMPFPAPAADKQNMMQWRPPLSS